MTTPYRFLLFDCMNTLFLPDHSSLPTVHHNGREVPSTAETLQQHLAPRWPQLAAEDIHAAQRQAWRWAEAQRGALCREVPASTRFRYMLELLNIHDATDAEITAAADAHIDAVIACYALPPTHRQTLEQWQQRVPLGLFSNFDHAPGVRRLLVRDGLADSFAPVVISAELGWRKPGEEAFSRAIAQVTTQCGVPMQQILFVGDSLEDDVAGAAAAGLDMRWFNPKGLEAPPHQQPPEQIAALEELLELF